MSDKFLSDFQEPPRPEFARSLYKRIHTPMKTQHAPVRRFALGTTLAALALTLTLVFSPTARAFASQLLAGIGNWFFSDDPTYAEQYEAQINSGETAADPVTAEPVDWQTPSLLTLADASAQAGFSVADLQGVPASLPLVYRFVTLPDEQNPFTRVTTTYCNDENSLVFTQTVYESGAEASTLPVGDAEVSEVTVQDVTGLWIENVRLSTYINADNQVEPKYANLLVWEVNGVEYWLQSTPGMSQADMLALANSVMP